MSREQLTQSQGHSSEATGAAPEDASTRGLPPDIYQQVLRVPPAAPEVLAQLLNLHRQFREQILELASSQLGRSVVKAALVIQDSGSNAGANLDDQQQIREMLGADAYKAPGAKSSAPKASEAREADAPVGASEAAPASAAAPTPAAAAPKKAEPPWVAAARRFNDAHMALVDEFNKLTDNVYALDERNTDPKAIAGWQRKHGLAADGMIGPKTVAAARADKNNDAAVAKVDDGKKGELIDA